MEHNLSDIVETLKTAKDSGRKCTLLIGAGCSVKAGIPTAREFVKLIEKEHPRAFEKAKDKTYSHYMAALAPGERRELITKYVDSAKINWAHVAIAQLLKLGFVDRVLTTNFDPLVVRACALVNLFPAVYDFASSQSFKPHYVPEQAIFYLHGQRSGFVLLNTPEECKKQADLLAPLFEDAGKGRVWIVVGYSGENDPVFDHLAKVDEFEYRLYWIGYKDYEPAVHVREKLLGERKFAFFVRGYDADDFFVSLTQQLGCFPPEFVSTPFSHLGKLMKVLTPYKSPNQDVEYDVLGGPRWMIGKAVERFEVTEVLNIRRAYMAGKNETVITLFNKSEKRTEEIIYYAAWSYIAEGNALFEQAESKEGEEAEKLYKESSKKYAEAVKIKPDMHEAINNWGNALSEQAKLKEGEEADRLYEESYKRYAEVVKIKPDIHMALNNWGISLSYQARSKNGEQADKLYAEAYKKYEAALKIKPDKHGALYNLAVSFAFQEKKEECLVWLEKRSKVPPQLYQEELEKDSDFDKVRNYEWFKDFLKKLPSEKDVKKT